MGWFHSKFLIFPSSFICNFFTNYIEKTGDEKDDGYYTPHGSDQSSSSGSSSSSSDSGHSRTDQSDNTGKNGGKSKKRKANKDPKSLQRVIRKREPPKSAATGEMTIAAVDGDRNGNGHIYGVMPEVTISKDGKVVHHGQSKSGAGDSTTNTGHGRHDGEEKSDHKTVNATTRAAGKTHNNQSTKEKSGGDAAMGLTRTLPAKINDETGDDATAKHGQTAGGHHETTGHTKTKNNDGKTSGATTTHGHRGEETHGNGSRTHAEKHAEDDEQSKHVRFKDTDTIIQSRGAAGATTAGRNHSEKGNGGAGNHGEVTTAAGHTVRNYKGIDYQIQIQLTLVNGAPQGTRDRPKGATLFVLR